MHPVRIFSPADVIVFLKITKNAMATNNPLTEVYGTMVSSSGTYTMRFTGNATTLSGIRTNYTRAEKKRLSDNFAKLAEKRNKEKVFLKFIRDSLNVTGVNLYKIKNNGTIKPKTLNTNDRVYTGDCDE